MFYFCQCMSVRCRTHTGFIGEQTSGHTETHRFLNGNTNHTACNSLGIESTYKNLSKCSRNFCHVCKNNNQSTNNIQQCHEWNQFLGYRSNTLYASNKDNNGNRCYCNTHCPSRYVKSRFKRISNCIGLYHISHKAQCQHN